jgi:hypothetical protein
MQIKISILLIVIFLPMMLFANIFLGHLNTDQTDPYSVNNPYGTYGNPYNAYSIHNKFGRYGNPYSNYSVSNPYATNAPKLYDQKGKYFGKLSTNEFDRESISNAYGPYGKYSVNSVLNVINSCVISIYGE